MQGKGTAEGFTIIPSPVTSSSKEEQDLEHVLACVCVYVCIHVHIKCIACVVGVHLRAWGVGVYACTCLYVSLAW